MGVIIPEKIYIHQLNQYVTNISGTTKEMDNADSKLEMTLSRFLIEFGDRLDAHQ